MDMDIDMEDGAGTENTNGYGKGNPFLNFFSRAFPRNDESSEGPDPRELADGKDGKGGMRTKTQEKKGLKKKKFLDMYGTNLTDLARNDKIDRVIGRDRE